MMLSIVNNEAKVCIDGAKLLRLLGLREEELEGEDGAIKVRDALLSKTEEEREIIFNKAAKAVDGFSFRLVNGFSTERENVETYYKDKYVERNISDIKRDIKRCKNYMQKKILQQELNIAYRAKKGIYM